MYTCGLGFDKEVGSFAKGLYKQQWPIDSWVKGQGHSGGKIYHWPMTLHCCGHGSTNLGLKITNRWPILF